MSRVCCLFTWLASRFSLLWLLWFVRKKEKKEEKRGLFSSAKNRKKTYPESMMDEEEGQGERETNEMSLWIKITQAEKYERRKEWLTETQNEMTPVLFSSHSLLSFISNEREREEEIESRKRGNETNEIRNFCCFHYLSSQRRWRDKNREMKGKFFYADSSSFYQLSLFLSLPFSSIYTLFLFLLSNQFLGSTLLIPFIQLNRCP